MALYSLLVEAMRAALTYLAIIRIIHFNKNLAVNSKFQEVAEILIQITLAAVLRITLLQFCLRKGLPSL